MEQLLLFYEKMLVIRRFEENVEKLYNLGLIPGLAHTYHGQEAVAVGVCSALKKDDLILSNHRGHGHSLAKDVPPKLLFAELFGKETGVCKGLGGSMHSTYLETGVLFSTAIVGGNIPIATGVGLAIKFKKSNRVVVPFFGDGATNTGAFHEGVNLASIWNLPVIFVCENNLYAISVPVRNATLIKDIAYRATSYGIPGQTIDGNDVEAVYNATKNAVVRARKNKGPSLLEFKTYRYKGHGIYMDPLAGRTKKELNSWIKRDPIIILKNKLLEKGISENKLATISDKVDSTMVEAIDFAKNSKYPNLDVMLNVNEY
jgi:TPP-dependent pyruvate/acetoin dehydrogenase alpha subunit